MNLNLGFAGFWLLIAAGLLYMQWVNPDQASFRIRGTNIPLLWLAVLLGLFNLVRWWSARSYARQRQARREEEERRERDRRRDRPAAPPEYNPAFDFNNPPRETETGGPQT